MKHDTDNDTDHSQEDWQYCAKCSHALDSSWTCSGCGENWKAYAVASMTASEFHFAIDQGIIPDIAEVRILRSLQTLEMCFADGDLLGLCSVALRRNGSLLVACHTPIPVAIPTLMGVMESVKLRTLAEFNKQLVEQNTLTKEVH
jgi:hypothetical protein